MGKGDKGGKKDNKKEKKIKPLIDCPFDGTTVDAAIVSAARLSHITVLNVDDILGYIWAIFIHIWAQTVQINLTIAFFWYIEVFEDAFEPGQVAYITPFIQGASGRAFNFTGINGEAERIADRSCRLTYGDFTALHVLFLTVFIATCLNELFKNFYRLFIIIMLPSTPAPTSLNYAIWDEDQAGPCPRCIDCSPDFEDEEDEEGKSLRPDYSIRNWEGEMRVNHMTWCWKFLVIVLVLQPHFLATILVFWTGVKYLALTLDPVKVAKTALKLGFLAAILKNYYTFFLSHNFRVYLQDGKYFVAKPKEDEEEEEEEEAGNDIAYTWNTWGSMATKFVLAFLMMMWVHYSQFSGLRDVRKVCIDYVGSLDAIANVTLREQLYSPWDSISPTVTWDNFAGLLF